MTEAGLTAMFERLDQVWGGVDEGREEGYRWVLGAMDDELVAQAVLELANEDRTWLPRAPEIAARVHRMEAERRTLQRIERRQQWLEAQHKQLEQESER